MDNKTSLTKEVQVNTPVSLLIETPGKQFYQRQVECLIAKDIDRLVDENYLDEAVLISEFHGAWEGKPDKTFP